MNIFTMKLSKQGIEFQRKQDITIPGFSSVDLNCNLILCLKHPLIFKLRLGASIVPNVGLSVCRKKLLTLCRGLEFFVHTQIRLTR